MKLIDSKSTDLGTEPVFVGQTPEQSVNTRLFLDLVADTYHTTEYVLIVRQKILRANTYLRKKDRTTRKRPLVLDENGEKIVVGRKGVDWSKPSVYEVAGEDELLRDHDFAYAKKVKRKDEIHLVTEPRRSLVDTLILFADEQTKFLH